ncbi:outer membrane protein [Alterisphingorhabdus coralli]|uniref:Outer membrane beta-barrel protein n=1 Tax=Alterisphingorhabdus coralli TaxID=3071408 RepID=A0AA97F5U4_9SPHN|nr:outer membrane beta-barrel protein [Parasphingorhabdus sp. SCSIO 66989]WOE74924.1 outer membrane beta-barrel protein [Parasphingorhabdus sp. SCSIO 66989]
MRKFTYAAIAAAAAATAMASPAMAQDTGDAEIFVGTQVGYHDLGTNFIGDDDGFIYGVYGGVDVPIGGQVFAGLEGNFNLGTNAIDSEYGIAGRLGIYAGDRTKLFVRGGYQEVNFDLGNVLNVANPPNIDDTDGDYLLGGGAEFQLNENLSFRAGIDTIAFDSVRLTSGLQLNF